MTQEQYKRAIEISNRLSLLEFVKKNLDDTKGNRLWYAYKIERSWELYPEMTMRCIGELLDKHERMIRDEIEQEIEQLKKEIETL